MLGVERRDAGTAWQAEWGGGVVQIKIQIVHENDPAIGLNIPRIIMGQCRARQHG